MLVKKNCMYTLFVWKKINYKKIDNKDKIRCVSLYYLHKYKYKMSHKKTCTSKPCKKIVMASCSYGAIQACDYYKTDTSVFEPKINLHMLCQFVFSYFVLKVFFFL